MSLSSTATTFAIRHYWVVFQLYSWAAPSHLLTAPSAHTKKRFILDGPTLNLSTSFTKSILRLSSKVVHWSPSEASQTGELTYLCFWPVVLLLLQ